MEYNLNENYDKQIILESIKDYLNNFSCIDTDFKDLDQKERDMMKYHNLIGLSSYLISCCYSFIKNETKFKLVVIQRFTNLQNECNELEINNELKYELIKNLKKVLDMINTME